MTCATCLLPCAGGRRQRGPTSSGQPCKPVLTRPVETNDDGHSGSDGELTGRKGRKHDDNESDNDDGDDDDDDNDNDDEDLEESDDDSERSSDDEVDSEEDPDERRERRRDKKRRLKAEKDRKAAFNSLRSPATPTATGTPRSPFVMVGGNDPTTKLERWSSGRSSNNAGFNWKAYKHHKDLYYAYMDT